MATPDLIKETPNSIKDRYALAIAKGYDHILALNRSTDAKPVFRAAVGHGYQPEGPINITADDFSGFTRALLRATANEAAKSATKKSLGVLAAWDAQIASTGKAASDAPPHLVPVEVEAAREEVARWQWKPGAPLESHVADKILQAAKSCAKGMHTHDGKLVSSLSSIRIFKSAEARQGSLPYLFSDTAIGAREVSAGFVHDPVSSGTALLFYAVFVLSGKTTSFAQLLQAKSYAAKEALVAAGLGLNFVEELEGVFNNLGALPTSADNQIHQQLWPTAEDSYCSIQAVPSLATYAELTRITRENRQTEYLPALKLQVGSGQAQNISIFASSSAGNLDYLSCMPPFITKSRESDLRRICWRTTLISKKIREKAWSEDDVKLLLSKAPQVLQHNRLRLRAAYHVDTALALISEVREAYASDDAEWEAAIAQLPSAQRNYVQRARLGALDQQSILEAVFECVPFQQLLEAAPVHKDKYEYFVRQFVAKSFKGI